VNGLDEKVKKAVAETSKVYGDSKGGEEVDVEGIDAFD
jgi:hypothetical protein